MATYNPNSDLDSQLIPSFSGPLGTGIGASRTPDRQRLGHQEVLGKNLGLPCKCQSLQEFRAYLIDLIDAHQNA